MNKQRRATIAKLHQELSDILSRLEEVRDEEQEYFDNMPESIQSGDKGSTAEGAISFLEDACNSVQQALDSIEII